VITELEEELRGKTRTRLMSVSFAAGQPRLRFGIGPRILGR